MVKLDVATATIELYHWKGYEIHDILVEHNFYSSWS